MVQIGPKPLPGLQRMFFDHDTRSERIFYSIFRNSYLKIEVYFAWRHKRIKNAFCRSSRELTYLSVFHCIPNAVRELNYVIISYLPTFFFSERRSGRGVFRSEPLQGRKRAILKGGRGAKPPEEMFLKCG